jgi:anti-sigma factor RsiW
MDSRDRHDGLLAAFLAGDLDPADAQRWDEHLLRCEPCWRAVREDRTGRQAAQVLRQPTPPGLADRVAFAVEMAAGAPAAAQRQARPPARAPRRGRPGRQLRWRLAGAGAVAAGLVATLLVALLPGGGQAGSVPAAVAAVARYAQVIPPPSGEQHPRRAAPVQVGRPVTVMVGGQRIVLRTWRLGGTEAVVAVSGHPFPMPARARGVSGRGMAWSVRLGRLGLYCLNGRTSELIAAPVPAGELAALAARLPLA